MHAALFAAVCGFGWYSSLLAELPDDLLTPLEERSSDLDPARRIAVNDRLNTLEEALCAIVVWRSFVDAYGNDSGLHAEHENPCEHQECVSPRDLSDRKSH